MNPPSMVELKLPRCAQPCPFTQFQEMAKGTILPEAYDCGAGGGGEGKMAKKN
jgi:hypothetical protein